MSLFYGFFMLLFDVVILCHYLIFLFMLLFYVVSLCHYFYVKILLNSQCGHGKPFFLILRFLA